MKYYIAYAMADKNYANGLKNFLQSENNEVLTTKYREVVITENIPDKSISGKKLYARVSNPAPSVDVFVAIITENSFKSGILSREVSNYVFNNEGKKIIVLSSEGLTLPTYLLGNLVIRIGEDLKKTYAEVLYNSSKLTEVQSEKEDSDEESNNIKIFNKSESESEIIGKLKNALANGKLTLMCGAGISYDAGIPTWDKLLENLFGQMLIKLKSSQKQTYDIGVLDKSGIVSKVSNLILGKYIKNNLEELFLPSLRDSLYKDEPTSCETIKAIVELSRPQRDIKSIDSIITFNFDALIEEALTESTVKHKAIYSEAVKCAPSELAIYHVHGYLPREGKIPENNNIVFSEDGYHSQFIEPFSWSNIIQIQKLTQNTCLLIGISLTDPNMRRLLDVAWRKNPDDTSPHFIIKKRPSLSDQKANDFIVFLEEQDANALGINIIWLNDHSEIPTYLRKLL